MRLIPALGMAAAVLAGFPSAGAGSSHDEETFEFRKGTRWKYVGTANGTKTTVTQEVFRISRGELFTRGEAATVHHLLMRSSSEGPEGGQESVSTSGFLGVEGGYFMTGSIGGAPVRLYKLGSRPGDTWLCTDPRLKSQPDRQFTHLGMVQVAVPAGVFRNARHVQVHVEKDGVTSTGDFYIVPGVGIVKTEAVAEGYGIKHRVVLELESFTPPNEF
jgi:hypothetical protein